MKMSQICGCSHHNLICISLLLLVVRVAVAGRDGGMMKMAIHDDMFSSVRRDYAVQIAGYGEEKLSTVLITGTVICDRSCSSSYHHPVNTNDQLQDESLPVAGAIVAATCHPDHIYAGNKNQATTGHQGKGVTDEYGEFIIDLPSHLHAIPDIDKACSVKILGLPNNSKCRSSLASITGLSKGLQLSSVGNGIRAYSAGTIQFMHNAPKQSKPCIKARNVD